jgi:cobalt-zinc-cadmium efflux system membrane fusion protein
VVPQSAVTYVDGNPTVFIAETDLRLIVTPVELGESDGHNREVVSGVTPGQRVVVEGVFALKSELFR